MAEAIEVPEASKPAAARKPAGFSIDQASVFYGSHEAIKSVSMKIEPGQVTAFIGPSGCGKSTLLRCLNRMNDVLPNVRVTGQIALDGDDIYHPAVDVTALRSQVGMVFQKSNPFPKSIFENVAYGLRVAGEKNGSVLQGRVESALKAAALWDEVSDRLHGSAIDLSGGQQQRVCIARALAVQPRVLLMDEPASALDPIATAKVEELIGAMRGRYTVVIVTHNMQQAIRVSDHTAFFYLGELVEMGETKRIFEAPSEPRTRDYVSGKFG